MRPADEAAEADDRVEALRRGLYRRGATSGDVDRYLAERSSTAPDPPQDAAAAQPPRWRRRRAGLALVAAVVLLGAAAATALSARHGDRAPTAAGTEAAPRRAAGEVVTPYGAVVPVPTAAAVSLEGATGAGQLYRGRGDSRFPLDVDGASASGGRVLIDVRPVEGDPIDWTASRVDPDGVPPERTFATGQSSRDAGPVVLRYRADPPVLLEITADTDQRWTAVVAFVRPRSAGR